MRLYQITLTPPGQQASSTGQQSNAVSVPTIITPTFSPGFGFANMAGSSGGPTYASFLNGSVIPSAWDIELDIPVGAFGSPGEGGAWLRIWGVSLEEIAQATQLQGNYQTNPPTPGYNVQIIGGMGAGLPLATLQSSQAGVLVQGQVLQAFGNWIGTDMTLEMVVTASTGTARGPQNFTLSWPPGTPLSSALQTTFQNAYSGQLALPTPPTVNLSSTLTQQSDGSATFGDLRTLASYVRQASLRIMNSPTYLGVSIYPQGGSFNITDGSQQGSTSPVQIQFTDLIGQPTWIQYPSIQIKTVMRGDLKLGGQIMLPQGILVTSTPTPGAQYRNSSVFQGSFLITALRHIGHFRQADAASWVTVITATPQPTATASTSSGPIQAWY